VTRGEIAGATTAKVAPRNVKRTKMKNSIFVRFGFKAEFKVKVCLPQRCRKYLPL
jgi:hypothetical protein